MRRTIENNTAPVVRGGCDGQGCLDCTTNRQAVAYKIYKRGRWLVVGKLTHFLGDNELILAVAWRNQHGTSTAISLPRAVLLDAKRQGAEWFYLRDDNKMHMYSIRIDDFLRGRLHADGEHYVLISQMQPVPWRPWVYAETEVYVDEQPAVQLALFEGVTA
jgi:hypothetical protein